MLYFLGVGAVRVQNLVEISENEVRKIEDRICKIENPAKHLKCGNE